MSKAKKLAEAPMPKTATVTFSVIKEIISRGWINIPADRAFNGNAAPGDYLEHLLDGKKNNRDSPDLNDWEIKFHGGNALITLFHKEPLPRGINSFLVREYGWPMEGNEYNNISFRHTLSGKSNRGFYVKNDIDRVWATLKRGVYGIYHSISVKYLQQYVNEFCFRYNNRKNADMFDLLLVKTVRG